MEFKNKKKNKKVLKPLIFSDEGSFSAHRATMAPATDGAQTRAFQPRFETSFPFFLKNFKSVFIFFSEMEKMINKRTYNHSVAFWDPRTPTTSVDEEGDRFRRKRWCRSLPCWYKRCQGS
ncbi:hypothetical protein ERO13_A10G172700v2 [Gossypium hirsutum]|nr:hypothetical protein ERO13_A10G172700v2 [Gossypium hirsutum]